MVASFGFVPFALSCSGRRGVDRYSPPERKRFACTERGAVVCPTSWAVNPQGVRLQLLGGGGRSDLISKNNNARRGTRKHKAVHCAVMCCLREAKICGCCFITG
jgi:hypothetical protein